MANATVHPNHALISSEDVEGPMSMIRKETRSATLITYDRQNVRPA
jgi:hypothetical protein